jgi:hypothetical protein
MNFYEVGYSTWEECPQIVLSHDEVYTQEEFNEILLDAYVEVNKKKEAKHNEWYISKMSGEEVDLYDYRPSVSNLFSDVVDLLVNGRGFKYLDFTAHFSPSDNYDLVPRKDEEPGETQYADEAFLMLRQRFNTIEPRDKKIDDILGLI